VSVRYLSGTIRALFEPGKALFIVRGYVDPDKVRIDSTVTRDRKTGYLPRICEDRLAGSIYIEKSYTIIKQQFLE
jgi:hypothetical protein